MLSVYSIFIQYRLGSIFYVNFSGIKLRLYILTLFKFNLLSKVEGTFTFLKKCI